ncbi:MAG: sugar kinase [Defluviitaleaceae bacterium]|nr:sugar kinase [Defluviitaleaceae bacterium]
MKKTLLIGEPMALLIADKIGELKDIDKFTRKISGAEVNVSVGLSRLGHKTVYLTKLGNDPFGHYIHDFLKKEYIDTKYISFDNTYKTGIQLKNKVIEGNPQVPYYRKFSASSFISTVDIEKINLNEIGYLHLTGIFPAISSTCLEATYKIIELAKKRNIFISFDPNLRMELYSNKKQMIELVNDISKYSDLILPGIEEANILTNQKTEKEICDFYTNMGIKNIVIKIGEKGAYVRENKTDYIVEGFSVNNVVDTVGAGDGFAVGIISGILEKLNFKEAVKRANAIGAIQIMNESDNEGLPTRSKLNDFLKSKITSENINE